MRYWEHADGTIHITTRPYRTTLCDIPTEDGALAGHVRPTARGIELANLCESCRSTLRKRSDESTAQS